MGHREGQHQLAGKATNDCSDEECSQSRVACLNHQQKMVQGVDFLVMEDIPGITLSEKIAAGPLLQKEVLRLGMQLAEGLAPAHEHGALPRLAEIVEISHRSDATPCSPITIVS